MSPHFALGPTGTLCDLKVPCLPVPQSRGPSANLLLPVGYCFPAYKYEKLIFPVDKALL